ncbi:MAG: hypothetical protein R3C14_30650 [Caldilineaceae bacterium]
MSTTPSPYASFTRYLAAKKSVDDRALNQHVWHTLQMAIRAYTQRSPQPLRIVEIGAGIGTMVERVLTCDLGSDVEYSLVDAGSENIATAKVRLPEWAHAQGFLVSADDDGATLHLQRSAEISQNVCQTILRFYTADCFDFANHPAQQQHYDLLIAHAFLDLVDVKQALPRLQQLLRPRALLYFTINFDGATILQPEIDPNFDAQLEALYHATMDTRLVNGELSGDSHTGRHLFGHLRNAGIEVLAAGSSDWVVFAGSQGYVADEAYFLHFIVETMYGALRHHPALDQARFAAWIATRHAQIDSGDLVYIAHQLDFVGRYTGATDTGATN